MSDKMTHRGPDDDCIFLDTSSNIGLGIHGLGMIDLARGLQTMPKRS